VTEITPDKIWAERQRQIEMGYDQHHDDGHGIPHLHNWAEEYAVNGKYVEALALLIAANDSRFRQGNT